jgi:molybdopterin-synthase adenylyltransferase
MNDDNDRSLRALPARLIETEDGVRLRRGCVEVRISGDGAAEIVRDVLTAMAGEGAMTESVCESFAPPDRDAVRELIRQLHQRRILVASDEPAERIDSESPLQVFYWHFGQQAEVVNVRLGNAKIAVVGVNAVSHQLVACLSRAGLSDIPVVDSSSERNRELFGPPGSVPTDWPLAEEPISFDEWDPDELGCLVATTDFGGSRGMREWNAFCLERGCHFFPIVLQDLLGFVGPLVVPEATACFECMLARWRSNAPGLESRWEALDVDGRHAVGFHPSMAAVLGALGAFELTKFYGIELPFAAVGRLIEVNLLTMEMESRKVLRLPRCPACSPLNKHPEASLTRSWFGFAREEEG